MNQPPGSTTSPPDALEALQPIQREIENWSESFLSQAFAPTAGVGLYLRLVRAQFDPTLWCEIVVVSLPDDRFLVSKAFGRAGAGTDDPGANGLRYECVIPWQTWRKRFSGAGRLVAGADLRSAPLGDGPSVPVELDVVFEAATPVFAEGLGEQFWAAGHYEQYCRVEGVLRFGGEQVEISGPGVRDHSFGARDTTRMANHVWVTAQFPSGRTLMLMDVRTGDGHRLAHAVVGGPDGFRDAEVAEYPLETEPSRARDGFRTQLDGVPLTATPLHGVPLSLVGVNEWIIGAHPDATHVLHALQIRVEWGDEVGHGYMERTTR